MNRAEHLQWSKNRALEFASQGDNDQAFASFQSDMNKHPETANHTLLQMGIMLLIGGYLSTEKQMKEWIIGFN